MFNPIKFAGVGFMIKTCENTYPAGGDYNDLSNIYSVKIDDGIVIVSNLTFFLSSTSYWGKYIETFNDNMFYLACLQFYQFLLCVCWNFFVMYRYMYYYDIFWNWPIYHYKMPPFYIWLISLILKYVLSDTK